MKSTLASFDGSDAVGSLLLVVDQTIQEPVAEARKIGFAIKRHVLAPVKDLLMKNEGD